MRDYLFITLTALIVVAQCETIFFTNSPSHLIGAKNVTSYKLLVKDSDPITIIEANKDGDGHTTPHHPGIITNKYHERNHASDRIDVNFDETINIPKPDFHVNLLANMGGSHHVDVEHTQNMHGALGFTVTGGPAAESNQNEYERRKNDQEVEGDSSNTNPKKVVYSPTLLKKFMAEYAEKLKNADHSVKSEIQKIHEKINKLQPNEGLAEILEFDKSIEAAEQKFGYRDPYQSDRFKPPSHKDKDGWVTLEAVPWSSSSVSKWYPHGGSDDVRRRPGNRPLINKDRFPSSWHDDNNDNDDYFNRRKPANIDRDGRPGVYSMWTKPTPMHASHGGDAHRPKPYKFSESSAFGGSHNKYNDNDYDRERDHYSSGRKPWLNHADIITDNRPSQFPPDTSYSDNMDRYHSSSSRLHVNNGYPEHQSESNGDWVLISTTKGYQYPPSRRQSGNRALLQSDTKASSVIINVAPQSMRMHKALRLSVLPALDPAKNTTFSVDSKRKPTTSHGGMLEVDGTHETVEEDVRSSFEATKKGSESMKHKSLKGKSQLKELSA